MSSLHGKPRENTERQNKGAAAIFGGKKQEMFSLRIS
jgi:hypothetical protein